MGKVLWLVKIAYLHLDRHKVRRYLEHYVFKGTGPVNMDRREGRGITILKYD